METMYWYFYVTWHEEVQLSSFIEQIKCESNVSFSFLVFHYLIVFVEYTYEVFGMFFALVFYSKFADYQGETHLPPYLFP